MVSVEHPWMTNCAWEAEQPWSGIIFFLSYIHNSIVLIRYVYFRFNVQNLNEQSCLYQQNLNKQSCLYQQNLNKQSRLYQQGLTPMIKTCPGQGAWVRLRDRPEYEVCGMAGILYLYNKWTTLGNCQHCISSSSQSSVLIQTGRDKQLVTIPERHTGYHIKEKCVEGMGHLFIERVWTELCYACMWLITILCLVVVKCCWSMLSLTEQHPKIA